MWDLIYFSETLWHFIVVQTKNLSNQAPFRSPIPLMCFTIRVGCCQDADFDCEGIRHKVIYFSLYFAFIAVFRCCTVYYACFSVIMKLILQIHLQALLCSSPSYYSSWALFICFTLVISKSSKIFPEAVSLPLFFPLFFSLWPSLSISPDIAAVNRLTFHGHAVLLFVFISMIPPFIISTCKKKKDPRTLNQTFVSPSLLHESATWNRFQTWQLHNTN